MQGDLAMLGGLRTAWRKLALGIGAAATAITGCLRRPWSCSRHWP